MIRSTEDLRIVAAHEILATLSADDLARKIVKIEVEKLEHERRLDEMSDRLSAAHGEIDAARRVLQVAMGRSGCSGDLLELCELARQALNQRKDMPF